MKRKSSSTTPPKQPQPETETEIETPSADTQPAGDQVMELKTEPDLEEKLADESMCDFIHSLIVLCNNRAGLIQHTS